MREISKKQMPLMPPKIDHPQAEELDAISRILDENPTIYKRLRRFRAGIEAGISWIKRCFGLTRCTWKGLCSFKSYVWASIVSANLLTIARKQLAS